MRSLVVDVDQPIPYARASTVRPARGRSQDLRKPRRLAARALMQVNADRLILWPFVKLMRGKASAGRLFIEDYYGLVWCYNAASKKALIRLWAAAYSARPLPEGGDELRGLPYSGTHGVI